MLAEATVLGGKESSPAWSILPALGSENALIAGDGMVISLASAAWLASPEADSSPDAGMVRPTLDAHWSSMASEKILSFFQEIKTFSTWACKAMGRGFDDIIKCMIAVGFGANAGEVQTTVPAQFWWSYLTKTMSCAATYHGQSLHSTLQIFEYIMTCKSSVCNTAAYRLVRKVCQKLNQACNAGAPPASCTQRQH